MAAKVDIFNAALIELGAELVTDPLQGSEAAQICNARFDAVRDAVLRAHPWNCALVRVELPSGGGAPAFGFARQFTLPNDPYALRVHRVVPGTIVYRVERRKILTDAAAPLQVLYIGRITDTEQYDALLVEALAARLAAAVAFRLTDSRPKERDMWDLYQAKLAEARSIDAQEGTPEELEADGLIDVRA